MHDSWQVRRIARDLSKTFTAFDEAAHFHPAEPDGHIGMPDIHYVLDHYHRFSDGMVAAADFIAENQWAFQELAKLSGREDLVEWSDINRVL
jgi:hypothetical protein